MTDGTWEIVNFSKIKPSGIKYKKNCDSYTFYRHSYSWDEVETAVIHHNKGKTTLTKDDINALLYPSYITLEHRQHPKRNKLIKKGKKIVLVDTNRNRFRGRCYMLNSDSILVKNSKAALQDVAVIKRPFMPTKILGMVPLGLG
ncbi:hypothetical protein OAD66_01900 [Bacteroidia bacterium]|nr:hypothetical protein [Bacteroidia bacterium]MDB9881866.1 hypothetical protein [Bacteroidia bacterium]